METLIPLLFIFTLFGGLCLLINNLNRRDEHRKYLEDLSKHDYKQEDAFRTYNGQHSNRSVDDNRENFYSDSKRLKIAEEQRSEHLKIRHEISEDNKKADIMKRIFAYPYDEFLFSFFSENPLYDHEEHKWHMSSESKEKKLFIEGLKNYLFEKKFDKSVTEVYHDMVYNSIIDEYQDRENHTVKVSPGKIITYRVHVVCDTDMDFDRWYSPTHPAPISPLEQRREEMFRKEQREAEEWLKRNRQL